MAGPREYVATECSGDVEFPPAPLNTFVTDNFMFLRVDAIRLSRGSAVKSAKRKLAQVSKSMSFATLGSLPSTLYHSLHCESRLCGYRVSRLTPLIRRHGKH
jgi:hypothetical protein